jgi:hypothetical protein
MDAFQQCIMHGLYVYPSQPPENLSLRSVTRFAAEAKLRFEGLVSKALVTYFCVHTTRKEVLGKPFISIDPSFNFQDSLLHDPRQRNAADMDQSLRFTEYAEQVSANAKIISTSIQNQQVGLPDGKASTLSAARAKLAEAAFELLTMSRDTGDFLVHLTVDVCSLFYQQSRISGYMLITSLVSSYMRPQVVVPLSYPTACTPQQHDYPS